MRMMRLAISLGVLLLAIMQASAQQPASPPPASQGGGFVNPFAACKSDISELCKDAPSGIGGRLQCLKANQDKLSPACMGAIQSVLGVVKAKAATMQNAPRPIKACQSDLATPEILTCVPRPSALGKMSLTESAQAFWSGFVSIAAM